jgi:hypothetical protein
MCVLDEEELRLLLVRIKAVRIRAVRIRLDLRRAG